MKRLIFCLVFVLLAFTLKAQEFDIKVFPEKVNILPGVPLTLEVEITNISKSDIWIAGKSLKDGIRGRIISLVKENGEELKCESSETSSMVGPFPDKPIQDKVIFKSGETFSLTLTNSLYFCVTCPITNDISGKWKGRVRVEIAIAGGSLVKDIKRVELYGENVIEIEKPQGEDLAYINAVRKWLKEADSKEVKGYTAEVRPLTWGELLNSFRIPVNQILLNKFPTSTYAGYVLARKIPDYSDPLFKPVPPDRQVKMARDEGRTVISFEDKDFEAYFQKLDVAGKAGNIPQPIKSSFYSFYGDLLVQRGRFIEAERAFKLAIEAEPQIGGKEKVYYQRAKQFLEALQSKGEKEGK